jgi:hypothetical protein
MADTEFFERIGPLFAEQAGTARANAQRQADVERLLAKAEYEYFQMRRELARLLPIEAASRLPEVAEPPGLEAEADGAPRAVGEEPTFVKAA